MILFRCEASQVTDIKINTAASDGFTFIIMLPTYSVLGNVCLIQLLTQNGSCDVNVPARCGTPMQAATHRQHARYVFLILERFQLCLS